MKSKRYVIIGASAAGMAAAEAIRDYDPHGQVCVLSQEADAPYFRPMIPFLISRKKTIEEIYLQGRGPYRSQNIDVRLDTRVARVDPGAQKVYTADGVLIAYDRLLIATGSRPIMPLDTHGLNTEGVMALRTLADAKRMTERARQSQQAVVLGAGLLGLKTAMALMQRGLAVTLVEKEEEILPWLMESDAAGRIRRALEDAGVAVIRGATVRRVQADSRGVCGVVLDIGLELVCQLMCIGIGVQPNTACLENSGIRVDGGVVTDVHTACSAPHVYAAGDAAVTFDTITGRPVVTGLWTNAVEMGRCAGANMAGRPAAYGGAFGILNATQVAGLPFVSMGVVHTDGTDYETHIKSTPHVYRKLVFSPQGDRLVGALFVGNIANAGLYRAVIREGVKMNGIKKQVAAHRLHYGHLLQVIRSGRISETI
jgi:nitrite reductase (NADH) large subunit